MKIEKSTYELTQKEIINFYEINRYKDTEEYLAQLFFDVSNDSLKVDKALCVRKIRFLCEDLKSYFNNEIDFICIDESGKTLYKQGEIGEYSLDTWSNIFKLSDCIYNNKVIPDNENLIKSAKTVFGPQFLQSMLLNCRKTLNGISFFYADYSGDKKPAFVAPFNWGCLLVFASRDVLKDNGFIEYLINKNNTINSEKSVLLYNSNDIKFSSQLNTDIENEIINAFYSLGSEKSDGFISTSNLNINFRKLADNKYLVTYNKNNYSKQFLLNIIVITIFILLFLTMPIIKYFWNVIVLKKSGNISIKTKLLFIFIFIISIPLLVLIIVSVEHHIYLKDIRLKEAHNWSLERLVEIDQQYDSYLKSISNTLDDYLDSFVVDLKSRDFNIDDNVKIKDKLQELDSFDFYCIASHSKQILTNDGFLKYDGELDNIKFNDNSIYFNNKVNDKKLEQIKIINIVGKRLCSDINDEEMPLIIANKLDLFVESILNKNFAEIVFSIINSIGNIKEWGLDERRSLTYFKLLSFNHEETVDYFLLAFWHKSTVQRKFIEEVLLPNINRNSVGHKFLILPDNGNIYGFSDLKSNSEDLKYKLYNISDKASDLINILELNDEQYVASKFKSIKLNGYSFIGLYPIRVIEKDLNNKFSIILMFILLYFLLTVGIANQLSMTFLKPIKQLEIGAHSIEKRNFEFRINVDSLNDEYSEVENVFNHTMESMNELALAKIVQEGMFPHGKLEQNQFCVFGKSVTMNDVGGDYFDYFVIDDNNFVALLGDVAGHGVGASILMSMAKSAIMTGKEYYKSPGNMLNYLHKMVMATKNSKQKKIMTFQYLCMNSISGNGIYGNAGGCSPCIVRHFKNEVGELKVGGAVLGAFKKAVYKDVSLELEPGDAIIFYSDGIVEAKNKEGKELGYEALFNILKEVYHADPEKYYNNIYAKYLEYISGVEPQDDLTLLIIMKCGKKIDLFNDIEFKMA